MSRISARLRLRASRPSTTRASRSAGGRARSSPTACWSTRRPGSTVRRRPAPASSWPTATSATAFPAIPLYAGMRPYDQVPFQWSLHRLDASGRLLHREFLADGRTDPRPEFARTLLAALRHRRAPILVWSSFESHRLAELAAALPEHAAEIAAARSRLVDLLPIVRGHVGHPEFGGSFSLKQVAPVLAPSVDYDDLVGVGEGGEASRALIGLALGALGSAEEEATVRRALLEY